MPDLTLSSLLNGHKYTVPLEVGMTVKDLCDLIFSLTDIPPQRVRLFRADCLISTASDIDVERTLQSCSIDAGTDLSFTTSGDDTDADDEAGDAEPIATLQMDDVINSLCESLRLAISPPPGGHAPTTEFIKRVRKYWVDVCSYEDADLQRKALAVMPLQRLQREGEQRRGAEEEANSTVLPTAQHGLTAALLRWFKREFFTWVDAPKCWGCDGNTTMSHVEQPSPAEQLHDASRTEVYACGACGAQVRFPRYNSPAKLLETRKGRCGEWANAFTLCCRAAGLRARVVHDWTDHVWTEVWCGPSDTAGRWVHADACEEVLDRPLLYEGGWGKKLTYCIATGVDSVRDVTGRYTEAWGEVLGRRTQVLEGMMAEGLVRVAAEAFRKLTAMERRAARARARLDVVDMARRGVDGDGKDGGGRTSGSADWIKSRGEDGPQR